MVRGKWPSICKIFEDVLRMRLTVSVQVQVSKIKVKCKA
jgi:hypothetical protein